MNENKAIIAVLANVILWSTFPLISSYWTAQHAVSVAFFAQVSGAVASFVALLVLRKRPSVSNLQAIVSRQPRFTILGALSSYLILVFFISSLSFTESTVSTVLLELWPIFAFLLVSRFFQMDAKLTPTKLFSILLSLAGLLLIAQHKPATTALSSDFSIAGIALALLAASASAFTALQAKLVDKSEAEGATLADAFECTLVLRLVTIPFAGLIFFATGAGWEFDVIASGVLLGLIAFSIASALAIYGIANTKSASITLLWFLTPPLSLIWLYFFADKPLGETVVIGFMLIFTSNLLLNFWQLRKLSALASISVMMLTVILVLRTPSLPAEHYYGALGIMVTFFAIFSGLLINRRHEEATADTQEVLRQLLPTGLGTSAQAGDDTEHMTVLIKKLDILDSVRTIRSELTVCLTLALAILIVAIGFRDETLIDSIVAVSVSLSICFTLSTIVDLSPRAIRNQLIEKIRNHDHSEAKTSSIGGYIFLFATGAILICAGLLIVDQHLTDFLY